MVLNPRGRYVAGGAGVLVWLWTPNETEPHNIYGGDPLVASMQRLAAAL